MRVNWGVPVDRWLRLDDTDEGRGEENANIQTPSSAEIMSTTALAIPAGFDSSPSGSIPNPRRAIDMYDPYLTRLDRDESPALQIEAIATGSSVTVERNVSQRRFSTSTPYSGILSKERSGQFSLNMVRKEWLEQCSGDLKINNESNAADYVTFEKYIRNSIWGEVKIEQATDDIEVMDDA
jgi:hypothetical protein